jgi:hypothetical protein
MTNDRIPARSFDRMASEGPPRALRNPRKVGRPKRKETAFERRVMSLVGAGEITAAEAARMLGVHRGTIGRRCTALGIDPAAARAAYLQWMIKVAARIGRRRN